MFKLAPAILFCTFLICATAAADQPAPGDLPAASALVARVVPQHAARFIIEKIPSDNAHDVFEIESRDGKIVLRGNNGVSVASALNWYLRNYCHCQLSWCGDNLNLPADLPVVAKTVHVASPFTYRVYFNYCTFSYTMAWWDWNRWQREIDWMAMNGVNMPLAITGQEAVWQATLRKFNMNDDEIRSFICGPAFFAWQWMANLEGWGGPLPQSWIDSHTQLGRQILDRQRQLGMTPILQGFTGFVPLKLKEKYPAARIQQKPNWCRVFAGAAQLDPLDPLFSQIGKTFIEEQTRLFGTDHWYAADPFHESAPPSTAPDYLTAVAKNVLATMMAADPDAKIAMQTWSMRQPMVTTIPEDRILMLDLAGSRWKGSSAFWGRPWVCGTLHNYGGRIALGGNIPATLTRTASLLKNKDAGKLLGVGVFPEAIEHNPAFYQAAFDTTWMSQSPDVDAWFRDYTLARYGHRSPGADAAWKILQESVYGTNAEAGSAESPICSRPALKIERAAPNAGFQRHYDPHRPWDAYAKLLDAADELNAVDPYRYDLVDVARQCLADLSIPLQRDISAAYLKKDKAALRAASDRFLDLAADLDKLLGTRREFLLGKWIADARQWATNDAERAQYEWNARLLPTVWGPSHAGAILFDYSNRQWSGLISGFYLPRWKKFLDHLAAQPDDDSRFTDNAVYTSYSRPGDEASPFYRDLAKWEYDWCRQTNTYPAQPAGDSVAIARDLFAKWHPLKDAAFARCNPAKLSKGDSGEAAIYDKKPRTLTDGKWFPAICSTRPQIWQWDVTAITAQGGEYEVAFVFQSGRSALEIDWVGVRQGGAEMGRDTHAGWTGNENRHNTYVLKLSKVEGSSKRILQASVHTAGGADSHGQIVVKRRPEAGK